MNKKWRNRLAVGLCITAITNVMGGSNINASTKDADEREAIMELEDLEAVKEAKIIKQSEVPENVIPIKFNDVEEAKKYIELVEENPEYEISSETLFECYDIENNVIDLSGVDVEKEMEMVNENEQPENSSEVLSSANTYTATSKKQLGAGYVHIDVEYTVSNQKFKAIKSISSYITGITFGNSWDQKSTSKSISNNGKKMSVTVKGVVTHYFLLDVGLTELWSETKTYTPSWTYSNHSSGGGNF